MVTTCAPERLVPRQLGTRARRGSWNGQFRQMADLHETEVANGQPISRIDRVICVHVIPIIVFARNSESQASNRKPISRIRNRIMIHVARQVVEAEMEVAARFPVAESSQTSSSE